MICYGNLTIGNDEEAQISYLKSVLKCVFAFEVSLTKFNSNFVLFTGNYFNSGICSRVLCQILGSWLSQCVRRDKGKITLCCTDIFFNRYDSH